MVTDSKGYVVSTRVKFPWDDFEEYHTQWKCVEMPELSSGALEAARNVKLVYPNAVPFYDTNRYFNTQFVGHEFAVGELLVELESPLTTDEFVMVVGNYRTNGDKWLCLGEWCATLDEAWQLAWKEISERIIQKLEK